MSGKSAKEFGKELQDALLTGVSYMEQYILYNRVGSTLAQRGITVYRSYVGNYFTSLEMNGITLTVLRLDSELKQCLDYPVDTPGLVQWER